MNVNNIDFPDGYTFSEHLRFERYCKRRRRDSGWAIFNIAVAIVFATWYFLGHNQNPRLVSLLPAIPMLLWLGVIRVRMWRSHRLGYWHRKRA